MTKIIIVGTIHLKWTPRDELHEVLTTINPDKVLIELSKKELESSREDSIRDEMFHAYDWAVEHEVQFSVFDDDENTLKEGVTGSEPEFLQHENKVKALLAGHSWKDLNNQKYWDQPDVKKLEDYLIDTYFDKQKMEEREQRLTHSVEEQLIDGVNVVVTGAGHLDSFKKHFPDAVLHFRQ